ncbi:hypothetical protein ACOJR9_11545 [Alteromonas sp. A081]|uniref:hypothetical protein n=1 Tax=Alteromonas sp. A081 TaxID=3410269 RepID=UPI003B985E19
MTDIAQKERNFYAQRHHAHLAEKAARQHCRYLLGKPEILLAIAALGAYKGMSDAKPNVKRNRKNSLIAIGKTALLSLFKL